MRKPKQLNLSRLRGQERREAWERIKQESPGTAEILLNDKFQSLVKAFDGEVVVPIKENGEFGDDQPAEDKEPG